MSGIAIIDFLLILLLLLSQNVVVNGLTRRVKLVKHTDHKFDAPVAMVDPKDGTARLFVVERNGVIKRMSFNGNDVQNTPFLTITSKLGNCSGYCSERGLLGLAFHPNYRSNQWFYVNYTRQSMENGEKVLHTIVSRFSASDNDPNVADPNSEVVILKFKQYKQNQ